MTFIKIFFYSVVFIALSLIPLSDLLQSGLPLTHDGQDHVARIANFYQNLAEGNMIPRWAGNLNWGFGHPILMFLYPLPSYAASLFHFLGFTLVDSVKMVFGMSYVLSGVAMYLWMRNIVGEKPGIITGFLYIYAPYRFVDLYVRGAIGEHMAFIFPPLICYFFLKLSKQYSLWYAIGGSFAIAGLILSHNAIALMFLPVIFLYGLFLIWKVKKILLIYQYISILVFGFGLSSFFWAPAFFEGKYTLRDIVTKGEYASRFVEVSKFIFGQWSYGISGQFTTQIGIMHWIMVLASMPLVFYIRKKRKDLLIFSAGLLIIFFLSLFIMTSSSSFVWEMIKTLQKFQFPWRFLSLSVFSSAVLGGIVFLIVADKFKNVMISICIILLLLISKDYWHAKQYDYKPDSFYTTIYNGTTDTGESAPIWSVRFMEKRPTARIEVVEGRANIVERRRLFTLHEYKITSFERSRIRENTLYFPGWEVFVDGRKSDKEFQDPRHRGLITFYVDEGEHEVMVKFSETKLRLTSDILSLGSFFILLFFAILKVNNIWPRYL